MAPSFSGQDNALSRRRQGFDSPWGYHVSALRLRLPRLALCLLLLLSARPAGAQKPAAPPASPLKADVVGRVVSPANVPVAGASVYWVSFADLQSAGQTTVLAVAQTDSAGRFHFANALPLYERSLTLLGTGAQRVTAGLPPLLLATAPGWGLAAKSLLAPGRFSDIRLLPATRLRLTLRDTRGQPVTGVRVHLDTLAGAAFAGKQMPLGFLPLPALPDDPFLQLSDAQGECVFSNLPQGMEARLSVDDPRFARLLPAETNVTLERAAETAAPAVALLASGTLIGRVTLGTAGRPVPDVPVLARAIADGEVGAAVTNAQGVFVIDRLRPGLYRVSADLRRQALPGWQAPLSGAARLTEGGHVTGIAVMLTRPGLRVVAPSAPVQVAVKPAAVRPAPVPVRPAPVAAVRPVPPPSTPPSAALLAPPPSAGRAAPPLSVSVWVNSPALSVVGQRGRILLLHFWNTRSEPGMTALASLQSEFDQNHADGVVVLGIHEAHAARADLAAVASQYALTYPLAIDAPDPLYYGQTFRAYGIRSIPSYVVVDRRGNVAYSGRSLTDALAQISVLTRPAPRP